MVETQLVVPSCASIPETVGCIGCGYVGSMTMIVLAYKNPHTRFVLADCNSRVISAYKAGLPPFHEPFLDEYMAGCRKHANIDFTTDTDAAVLAADILFVAVDTPSAPISKDPLDKFKHKGRKANLQRLKEVAARIGSVLVRKFAKTLIVLKSTMPIGAEEKFISHMSRAFVPDAPEPKFSLVCVPEFLAEGTAIHNLLHPDRIIIGGSRTAGPEDLRMVRGLYNWIDEKQVIYTDAHTAQLGKLAANAMLAQRVSSINSLTPICEMTDANIQDLKLILGSDSRIGPLFLNPSPGFGGSCFKKDILSLVYISEKLGLHEVAMYWNAVVELNEYQKRRLTERILATVPSSPGEPLRVCVLGASFKQGTSDTRESSSITVCTMLAEMGTEVHVFDPKATRERFLVEAEIQGIVLTLEAAERIKWFASPLEAARGARAVVILTDWEEFRLYDYADFYVAMEKPAYLFDYRRMLNADKVRTLGFVVNQLGAAGSQ